MAVVRMTYDLRYSIVERVAFMLNKQIEELGTRLRKLPVADACLEKLISPEFLELADKLNEDPNGQWVRIANSVNVELSYQVGTTEYHYPIEAPFAKPRAVPLYINDKGQKLPLTPDIPAFQIAVGMHQELIRLVKERNALVQTLKSELLYKCTTLWQVVNVWPSVLDFVDDQTRRRYYAETPNKKRKLVDIQLSDEVKLAIMKVRILNGNA